MSEGFDYTYELSFINNFDKDVIQYSAISVNNNQEFIDLVESTVNNIILILSLQPGVGSMSTFINFEDQRYKINLTKI